MLTAEMRDALAASQAAFDEAEIYDNWVPDDGTYNALLKGVKVTIGENKQTKKPATRTTLIFQVLDGDAEGREFTLRFTDERAFLCGNLFSLAVSATGDNSIRTSKSYLRAVEALSGVEGQLVATIRKYMRAAKDGKEYPEYEVEEVNLA